MTPEERADQILTGYVDEDGHGPTPWGYLRDEITAAVRAAVAQERERCAKVAEADANPCPHCNCAGHYPDFRAKYLAEKIRSFT